MKAVSKYQPLQHYTWGDCCDGWNLVDTPFLSVKQERMPPGAFEARHYHQKAQQFFFVLQGVAHFEVGETLVELKKGEGLHIDAGKTHRILNRSSSDLEFILCSQPSTFNDRINCQE
jgi:mannose-6-phosphate isomerase-like protein (cupin superfamily)